MRQVHDLSSQPWTVAGFTPHLWEFSRAWRIADADVPPVPARVPGSVQAALRTAGVIPDWHLPLQSRLCEWVENRHWVYHTEIPDGWLSQGLTWRLECLGLDYSGWVFVNQRAAGRFVGTHVPHSFDVASLLQPQGNTLDLVFDLPPRWLGQFGYTSRMTEWKTRFNYTWDWVPRLVQIGVWDSIRLVATSGSWIEQLDCSTALDQPRAGAGRMEVRGEVGGVQYGVVRVVLEQDGTALRTEDVPVARFGEGVVWERLPVELWWPNLEGPQPLYTLSCRLLHPDGTEQDRWQRRVGFKHVSWRPCDGAPAAADPWLCVVNGRPVFLQGVNFAPIRANYADLTREDYAKRLGVYRELGCNALRINACGFLEKEWFFDLCDELGLMVWQEFPLTSSGVDNWPPEDEASIEGMAAIAASFIRRRRHHVSLLLWSGGNELMGDLEGRKTGMGKPCGLDHPMLGRLARVAGELDPQRRYIPTSPSGPRASAALADFGKGLHWDVHGPYAAFPTPEEEARYWAADDALFRSEMCCPGAAPLTQIESYAGDCSPLPATADNPYWNHPTCWWIDWPRLTTQHGRPPADLAEYVAWSQQSQAEALSAGMRACKDRFPACGGVLLWTGHDTFPIPINTSILDFDGNPKPAALALAGIWRTAPPWSASPTDLPRQQ